ncbi:hypothetical protein [Cohnella sp. GCM10027633]|uniref:hypothetical protein n=1 Tax=unclassified Cohnella TaxID=2636738 RepID=UPI003633CEA9
MFGRGDTKYPVPLTLKKLKEIDSHLFAERNTNIENLISLDFDFDLLNQDADFAYNNHPLDVIPFALTAFAGEHFGFLTDFGTVIDLENASIVHVEAMPAGEFHVTLIAINLKEFLGLLLANRDWISYIYEQNIEEDKSSDSNPDFSYFSKLLNDQIDIWPLILDNYRENLIEIRSKRIVVSTLNGIGITRISSDNLGPNLIIDSNKDYEYIYDDVKNYLKNASIENKLACIVDLQELGVLASIGELNEYLINELKNMGFFYESKMLGLTNK